MYISRQRHLVTYADLFRWCGRVSGAILYVAWLWFAIAELARSEFRTLSIDSSYHAAALAMVFFGYAVGWREELLGGLFAILGTAAYFLTVLLTAGTPPGIEAVWFSAPGMLYLLAWQSSHRHAHRRSKWRPTDVAKCELSK
jgi:hypothetical protein